jgi:hypothetical protein
MTRRSFRVGQGHPVEFALIWLAPVSVVGWAMLTQGPFEIWLWLFVATGTLVYGVLVLVVARTAVVVASDGVVVRDKLTTKRFSWADVASFEVRRNPNAWGWIGTLVTVGGQVHLLRALTTGEPLDDWHGERLTQAVAELERRRVAAVADDRGS